MKREGKLQKGQRAFVIFHLALMAFALLAGVVQSYPMLYIAASALVVFSIVHAIFSGAGLRQKLFLLLRSLFALFFMLGSLTQYKVLFFALALGTALANLAGYLLNRRR